MPDGRTLTVLLLGLGGTKIALYAAGEWRDPVDLREVHDPRTSQFACQATFECPPPDPDDPTSSFRVTESGSAEPLPVRLLSRSEAAAAVVGDAFWDMEVRWRGPRHDAAIWTSAVVRHRPRVHHVDVGATTLGIQVIGDAGAAVQGLALFCRGRDDLRFQDIHKSDLGFVVPCEKLARYVVDAGLVGDTLWNVRALTSGPEVPRLKVFSRDVVDPRSVRSYPSVALAVPGGRVSALPYWSLDGFLCVRTRLAITPSSPELP